METHSEKNDKNWEMLVYMLDNTKDPSAMKDDTGYTLVHKAATINSMKNLSDLLIKLEQKLSDKFQAFINEKNHDGQTALDLAIKECSLDNFMLLIQNGADCTTIYSTVLHRVINIGAEKLIDKSTKKLNKCKKETIVTDIVTDIVNSAKKELTAEGFKNFINTKDSNGFTALDLAIKLGYVHIVYLLLSNEADVGTSATDDTHSTSLHHAISLSRENDTITKITLLNIILLSLKKKPNTYEFKDLINKEDINGSTILNYAIELNAKDIVDFLIKEKINIHTKDSNNLTVLHHAMKIAVTRHINKKSIILRNIINLASEELGSTEFKDFIEAKDSYDRTALQLAIQHSFEDIANLLIKKGANLNTRDNKQRTILHNTLKFNIPKDINKKSTILSNIINLASKKLSPEGFKDFIDAQDYSGHTALQLAAKYSFKDIINLLIEKGADVTTRDRNDFTALHYSIYSHDLKNKHYKETPEQDIDELIDTDKRIFHKDNKIIFNSIIKYAKNQIPTQQIFTMFVNQQGKKNGLTAIHLSIKHQQYELFKLLLEEHNPNPQVKKNLVIYAAIYGEYRIIKYLLKIQEVQDIINIIDEKGETVLHKIIAADETSMKDDTIHLLIKKGIDVNIKNKEGKTALCIAVDKLNELIDSNNYNTLSEELKKSRSSLSTIVITLWVNMLISYENSGKQDKEIQEEFLKIKSKIDTMNHEMVKEITQQMSIEISVKNRKIYDLLVSLDIEEIRDNKVYHILDVTDDPQAEIKIVNYTDMQKRTSL